MGIKRIVDVLNRAPEDLTPAERLVLVVIAENINDGDPKRQTWPDFSAAVLAKRAGLTAETLRKALQRLAKRGMEVRVPIATGKDGRALYAVPGHQCRYRLPLLEGGNTFPPCGTEGGNSFPEGGNEVPPKAGTGSRQAGTDSHPSPHPSVSPQAPLLSPPPIPEQRSAEPAPAPAPAPAGERETDASPKLSTAQKLVRAAAVVSEDEEPAFIAWATRTHNPRGGGWWRTVRDNGDLPGLVADWRTEQQPAAAGPAGRQIPPWCGQCDGEPIAERWQEGDDGRVRQCPRCHPDAIPTHADRRGHQPYRNPVDQSAYDRDFWGRPLTTSREQQQTDAMFDRAMARAQARMNGDSGGS